MFPGVFGEGGRAQHYRTLRDAVSRLGDLRLEEKKTNIRKEMGQGIFLCPGSNDVVTTLLGLGFDPQEAKVTQSVPASRLPHASASVP